MEMYKNQGCVIDGIVNINQATYWKTLSHFNFNWMDGWMVGYMDG